MRRKTSVADFGFFEAALVLGFAAGMMVVLWWQLRTIRKKREKVMARIDDPEAGAEDRAYNQLLATQVIRDTLRRGGTTSPEADSLIEQAALAREAGAHTRAVELGERARNVLLQAKARSKPEDQMAKLNELPGNDEETTKEKLTKEVPPNYMQSKFTMNLARDSIATQRGKGGDVGEAERLLQGAETAFQAEDYTGALSQALQAKRMAEETLPPGVQIVVERPGEAARPAPTPQPATAVAPPPSCDSCGALLRPGDDFCRQCGAKAELPQACPSCGTPRAGADGFCRRCGARF